MVVKVVNWFGLHVRVLAKFWYIENWLFTTK